MSPARWEQSSRRKRPHDRHATQPGFPAKHDLRLRSSHGLPPGAPAERPLRRVGRISRRPAAMTRPEPWRCAEGACGVQSGNAPCRDRQRIAGGGGPTQVCGSGGLGFGRHACCAHLSGREQCRAGRKPQRSPEPTRMPCERGRPPATTCRGRRAEPASPTPRPGLF
jgi:hypothetical protein